MTDLRKLYAAIEGRTKGPWRYAQLLDGIEARALLDGGGYHFGQIDDIQNGEFIATIGTCADQIAAVLRAVVAQDEDQLVNAAYNINLAQKVHEALAALAALDNEKEETT
jgi:hypothetical protein